VSARGAPAAPASSRRRRGAGSAPVVWRLQLDDADIASVRYRCLIPVRHLRALGVQSRLSWGRFDPLAGERPAAIVFVKSFRDADVAIAERAVADGIPVLLDVCDNVFSADYHAQAARDGLRRMAALADVIVTTGPALAGVLREQLGAGAPVHEVVDALETPDDVRFGERLLWRERVRNGSAAGPPVLARTGAEAAWRELARLRRRAAPAAALQRALAAVRPRGGGPTSASLRPPAAGGRASASLQRPEAGGLPQVIWYGNAGSVRPRFGIVNLADIGPQLEAAARRTPFELLVVSSDEEAYRREIAPLDLPTRYAPWHRRRIAEQIRASAVALVPNSRDDFSVCKSANRAVGALHAGVPVVATRTPALEPLEGSVWFDDFEAGVSGYLAEGERARADVARARTVIEASYSGAAVARAWNDVLTAAGIVRGP
jgi:hypothetical protein